MVVILRLLLLAAGFASTVATDEFLQIIGENEDIKIVDEPLSTIMYIVPSGNPGHKMHKPPEELSDYFNQHNDAYEFLKKFTENTRTMKSLTFNIYDDSMREATISLFRMLQELDKDTLQKVTTWLKNNINTDMLDYLLRLVYLYTYKLNDISQNPPFKQSPKYFTNAETIAKANRLNSMNGNFLPEDAEVNQFYRTDDLISINTNYSEWNLLHNDYEGGINYFREDIGLNSYYYGIHLLHPFWMSNEELDEMNPRQSEHYYYSHQQLLVRYKLEIEHLKEELNHTQRTKPYSGYNSYLRYENGLSFPVRYSINMENNREWNQIKLTNYAIIECISRGFIVMNNGTVIHLTEDNHTDLLIKLVRSNFDNAKLGKVVRSLYASNGYPIDIYDPAPSVLHHPQTTIRDVEYWKLIKFVLNYIVEYRKTLEPFNFTDYETNEYKIVNADLPNITTYFEYYQFDISESLNKASPKDYIKPQSVVYAARQKRLQHEPFSFNISVNSKVAKDVIVRFFIRPQCTTEECVKDFTNYFELDIYRMKLREGMNSIVWSPDESFHLSNDDEYNLENRNNSESRKRQKYNMFKFPKRLVIPKGRENGLKLKLFVMITDTDLNYIQPSEEKLGGNFYKNVCYEVDTKPLGFPFHRMSNNLKDFANNYRLYDIFVFHKKYPIDKSGYFSSNLY